MGTGARQSGKSTLVQSNELEGRQCLTFDDVGVLAAAKADPNGFLSGLGPKSLLMKYSTFPSCFGRSNLLSIGIGSLDGSC